MNHPIRLQTLGGWGFIDPQAFAFDLSRAAAWKMARKFGVRRYGKAPSSGDDDTRPIAPAYRHLFISSWVEKANVRVLAGNALNRLESAASLFGASSGFVFTDGKLDNAHAFGLPIRLGANESVGARIFVHNVDGEGKEASGHIWHLRIGEAGAGILFQIRDGKPEIARLSKDWTRGLETQLRLLWALEEPMGEEETQIEDLQKRIYSSFDSLSFEKSTGRDKWRGDMVLVTLIPEPRGALHIVLEGGDATMIEFPDLIEKRSQSNLWNEGAAVEVGATGGAWILQTLGVRFGGGSMEYGPYKIAGDVGALEFAASSVSQRNSEGENIARVTFAKVDEGGPQEGPPLPPPFLDGETTPDPNPTDPNAPTPFKFKATFSTTDARYGAWLYGLSARLENGPRTGLSETEITFDSDDLSGNEASGFVPDVNPILDCRISCDESGARSATLSIRDINGRTLQSIPGGIDAIIGRACNLTKNEARLFTQAIVTRGRLTDVARMAAPTPAGPRRFPIDVSKAETRFELEIGDGHQILRETLCNPAIISDGKHLGAALRQRYRLAGYSLAEMARTPVDLGPLLPRADAGEDWAIVTDESDDVDASCEALMDRFGLGLRRYQDENGVWVLERRPTNIVAAFTSSAARNDPNLLRGGTRAMILDGFDWERDNDNFYNSFRVVGGEEGKEIVRDYFDAHSMQLQNGVVHSRWVGRLKEYPTLRDSGLRTPGAVNYALRSLVDRYGKPGRMAQFESYFVREFAPLDRVTLDGVLCEVLSWDASTAEDSMQIRAREIL